MASGDTGGLRVFVSHTSELREFPRRGSYVAAVERAVAACGHVIVDMADFPAGDLPPVELCAQRVRSCDVYVGVLGTRYGSPVRERPELSYTELEFEVATGAGLERLVFLLDAEADHAGIPVSKLVDLEFGGRQEAFRRRVGDAGLTVQSFGSPAELGMLAERSLRGLGERPAAGTGRDGTLGVAVRLAPRPAFLAGRESLLAGIGARLAASPGRPGPRVAVLCGLGGAGKTSVAIEYAHRHLAGMGTGVCWQFAAEDPAMLTAEFEVLAAELGVRQAADGRAPVAAVHTALARAQAGWLVIFDNAPDLASVEAFLPSAGPGQVLVTSQSQHWPAGWEEQVPVLEAEVAARFLADRTGDGDLGAASALAEELGGLPLALEQAGAYIKATGISLATYLGLFRERQADLLARGEAAGHRQHVAATLGLALSRLESDMPAAAGLARLLAFLAPDPTPLGLLLDRQDTVKGLGTETATALGPLAGDPVAVGDAVAALRRYSLASLAGEGLVQVHRLVQAVTRAQLTTGQAAQWRQAAAALVNAAIPADGDPWEYVALLPHARAVLDLTSLGISQIVLSLIGGNSYAAARDLLALAVDAYEDSGNHGPDHPETLAARNFLARMTGAAGNAAGARDQYAALLPVIERASGPGHAHTLITRADLAHWTGEAGDAAGARDQYAALLPDRKRRSGPDDPATLTTRAALAYWTGHAGDVTGARDQSAALLPVIERVSGPDHPATLTTRADLAYWTGHAGDVTGARDQYAALLPIRERVSGPEHPDTLITRGQLAFWNGKAGDAAGARDQYAALLPIRERVSGPEHPDTLTTRADLALWTGEAGDAAGARDQYAALLPIRERVSGPDHPHTLTTRANLALWTGEAGDAAGARDQYAALLPIRERISGPDHPDTLIDRGNLANWTIQALAARLYG